jgi:hypothetical protein
MRASALIGLLLASVAFYGYSQAGTPEPGFSVPAMIGELAIFLPESPTSAQQPEGQQAPSRPNGLRALVQSHRDPRLFFDLAQVDSLLPLLQALWQNPFPTPHAAKKLQATLDGLLTPAQRAALERFRRERDELIARAGQQAGGAGGSQQPGSAGRETTPLLRRQAMIEALIGRLKQRKKELAAQ